MNNKIARFLSDRSPETPCLVVDLDVVADAYDLLCRYLSVASVYYAVKANPAPEIVAMLAATAPTARSHCPRSVCCEPTWNDTP